LGKYHPLLFKILGIPKPLRAEIISKGEGGQRIAYFDSGKRFMQEITTWKPLEKYSFDFNPEKGFIVGHFFDLSDGIFKVPNGSYLQLYSFQQPTVWIGGFIFCSICQSD
jgi:hypothetical protein